MRIISCMRYIPIPYFQCHLRSSFCAGEIFSFSAAFLWLDFMREDCYSPIYLFINAWNPPISILFILSIFNEWESVSGSSITWQEYDRGWQFFVWNPVIIMMKLNSMLYLTIKLWFLYQKRGLLKFSVSTHQIFIRR